MRIALLTEVFLPKIDGVVTRTTRHLDQLAELGHEVLVFEAARVQAELLDLGALLEPTQ